MSLPEGYEELERVTARALRARDPAAAFAAAAEDDSLPEELRSALRRAAPDGVRIAALLVARLRFERLVRGSAAAAERFERDPKGFADSFRRYHEAMRPEDFLPRDEARTFERWWREAEGGTVDSEGSV